MDAALTKWEKTARENFTMQSINLDGLHVAIIMDGNGRWATRRGLPRIAGHRAGVAALRRVVERAPDVGIRCLTVYAFSSDNWRRPTAEVESIFWLLRAFLRLETERLRQRGARLQVIGRRDRLAHRCCAKLRMPNAQPPQVSDSICVSPSIIHRAMPLRSPLLADRTRNLHETRFATDGITQVLTQTLTAESGDVDLLIRTGGEKRLSDFLLWESAYAELHFTDCMWPDFDEADFEAALNEFSHRERRFGGVPEPAALLVGGVQ